MKKRNYKVILCPKNILAEVLKVTLQKEEGVENFGSTSREK
jgi:hypothetical protein